MIILTTTRLRIAGLRAPDLVGMLLATAIVFLSSALAQESHKPKVLEKITSGGPTHVAFSGNIQSIDLEHELLNLNPVRGGDVEIFPVKKGVHVSGPGGEKLKLKSLTPGTNVIVYYDQKGPKRTVTQIVVLASESGGGKKPHPTS